MIQLDHVTRTFGDFKAVDDITVTVPSGSITGFIGPNGAGKTTTISMICGILRPNAGSITVEGLSIEKDPLQVKEKISMIPDSPDLFLRLSAMEYIEFLCDLYDIPVSLRKERIEKYAEEFGMTGDLNTQMKDYSHGMRQKALIIASLCVEPPVWILDEPMTGLDPAASFLLKQKMREAATQGRTVFFSTHVLEVAEKLCDKIIMIDQGKIIFDGKLEELKERYPSHSLEEIFLAMTGQLKAEEEGTIE